MNVALSDVLTCPRCGPTYGLVLVPYEVEAAESKRVRSGVLGCANCRERYRIEGGVADLRVGSTGAKERVGAVDLGGGAGADVAVRLAGLMGLADARGTVLVAGPAAAHGPALAELVGGVEVVVEDERSREEGGRAVAARSPARARVSRIRVTGVLPFRSHALRGVALTGSRGELVEEGARVLGGAGRLVLAPAPRDARGRLEAAGLEVAAEEGGVVVAGRAS